MARPLFSPSWHSVAPLKPQLVGQAQMHRHVYSDQVWFVASDPVGGKFHRLSPTAHAFVIRMDGQQSVQQIWDAMCAVSSTPTAGRDIPTQDEIVNLLMQLHAVDLLRPDVTPDATLTLRRHTKRKHQTWKQWLMNPMSLKLPLVDPDQFLSTWVHYIRWLFGPVGAVLWLAVVLPAAFLAAQHYGELTANLSDRVMASSNLWVMAAVFPVVKLLHELGHGFATKAWGGHVHEMGAMLLVFAPAPYVDASAASAFRSKWRRAFVGAAGMVTEVFLAALALYVWLLVEPGLVRAIAFNVMVVAGVSTLVVNGNPLLRYDAYYILCDLLEMPNLAQRGQRYLQYLWNKRVFGITDQDEPDETPAQRRWLAVYTVVSWCYRVFITLSIAIFVAGQFFIFGVLVALKSLFSLVAVPLWKAKRYVLNNPTLQRRRQQAVRIYFGLVVGLVVFAIAVPLPSRTQSEGVVWLPEQSMLRAGTNGFFSRWLVAPGTAVKKGTAILVLEDPLLIAELDVARARVAESQARLNVDQFSSPSKAVIGKRQLLQEQQALARAEERFSRLVLVSEGDGIVTAARSDDMPGQFYKKGELLGYLLENRQFIARVVVQQADIDLVRTRYRSAKLRMADSIPSAWPSAILRESPGGLQELPSPALSSSNGGTIATDPKDGNGVKALERIFVFDMRLPPEAAPGALGERVHVRFSHAWEPLALQGWRRLRQLLLSRFTF